MRLSLDSKPLGVFIEYTLKPLIEESRDLLDLMDKHDLKAGDVIQTAFKLYLIDMAVRSTTTLIYIGMICFTAYLCLSTTR